MNELALFAGAGGGILGGKLLGWRTVCAVEREPYAASVLVARQNDGFLPPFPIWDDVCTFDGRPWRGRVDVVSGGFPCQDISTAGKGAGIDGARSGLWSEMARIIREVGPRYVFVENSPMLTSRGLGRVLGDLAAMGYDARWGVLGAVDAGAPHKRDRIWIVAHSDLHEHRTNGWKEEEQGGISSEHRPERCARGIGGTSSDSEILADARRTRQPAGGAGGWQASNGEIFHLRTTDGGETVPNADDRGDRRREQQPEGSEGAWHVADSSVENVEGQRVSIGIQQERSAASCSSWWATEPDVGRVANGVAARVDRLRCIGNGQVPAVAQLAWRILTTSR